MKISFYDKVNIATHIERKISQFGIDNHQIKVDVYEDMYIQIKREYGISRKHPNLDEKYLADVHDFIDCYQLPRFLEEQVSNANYR